MDSVNARGSVIPIGQLGIMLQLLENIGLRIKVLKGANEARLEARLSARRSQSATRRTPLTLGKRRTPHRPEAYASGTPWGVSEACSEAKMRNHLAQMNFYSPN